MNTELLNLLYTSVEWLKSPPKDLVEKSCVERLIKKSEAVFEAIKKERGIEVINGKELILNGSDQINVDRGDYIVLCDGGAAGFEVIHQSSTCEDALLWMIRTDYSGGPLTLVKLVHVEVCEQN